MTPDQDPQLGALPHRGHQGAARASGAGGDRELARASSTTSTAPPPPRRDAAGRRRAAKRGGRRAKARAASPPMIRGTELVLPSGFTNPMLDSIVKARGGSGAPTGRGQRRPARRPARHDRQDVRRRAEATGGPSPARRSATTSRVYPAHRPRRRRLRGLRLLLDISDPVNPTRIGAVADSNFSYWHSATFNNDGTKILFSDEWGGGGPPKCRATDPKEWGADAIFTIENGKMAFQSYYKLPAVQTAQRELRGAQRLADPDPGPRRDGAGLVPGRHLGLRLDRRRAPEGDRLLRPRPGGLDPHGDGRLLVGVLVQRRDRQLRDRARARHLRADAERLPLAERDRRGQDGAVRLPQRAGPAEVRLAGELRAGARLPRSAGAVEGSVVQPDRSRPAGVDQAPRSCRRETARTHSTCWPPSWRPMRPRPATRPR